jgi:hypothetical protein
MILYWLTCFASVHTTDFGMRVKHNNKNFNYYLFLSLFASLPLNIVASIRYNVGEDYLEYVRYFDLIASGYNADASSIVYFDLVSNGRVIAKLEYVYYGLNKALVALGGDYRWLFAVCSTLFLLFVFLEIFRDSPYPKQSVYFIVAMSYYFIFMNAMRQMIGCAILLFSLRYVENRKFFPFLCCVIVACGFHITCIVFVIVYFIGKIDFKPKCVFATTVVLFVTSHFFGGLLTKILYLTPYARYIGSGHDSTQQGYIVLAINILLVVLGAIFYDKGDKRFRIYFNLQVIAMWVSVLTGKVVLISRLRWMFGLPSIILLPLIFSKIKDMKLKRFISWSALILYFVYCTYKIAVLNANTVLPYQTIFSQ